MPQVPKRDVEVLGKEATVFLLLPVHDEGCPWLQHSLKGNRRRRRNAVECESVDCHCYLLGQ